MSDRYSWRRMVVRGIVQGVGFRPAIWRHATALGLLGGVCNTLGEVVITVGGPEEKVDEFQITFPSAIPRVAKIASIHASPCEPLQIDEFQIFPSEPLDIADVVIPPDLATCDDCLREILSDSDRRSRYAFTACTQCGPRYTMVESLPYDRERTTMDDFPLCPQCANEYDSPADRRYHAECTACPECGPELELLEVDRESLRGTEALERAFEIIGTGGIGAIKGIGGYHLCCDALNAEPIGRLRERKRRPKKPFAVMASSVEAATRYCRISNAERDVLLSPERPIVLMQKFDANRRVGLDPPLPADMVGQDPPYIPETADDPRTGCTACATLLAPGNARLGVMLPYTPLHHLLLAHSDLLVMTSANESEEPIFNTEEEVAPWLGTVVDFILTDNRRIWNKCDDSVMLLHGDRPTLIRRARGFVPLPVELNAPAKEPMLCCGGDLKNVFALVRDRQVYLSTHMGDLENAAALENYRGQIERMKTLLHIEPHLIVHDLHPGYHSTQYALGLRHDDSLCGTAALGCAHQQVHKPLGEQHSDSSTAGGGCATLTLAVQHHHAHLAACLAENNYEGPAIGLIFDGTGYGADGSIWGGEFLVGDAQEYRRMASFMPVSMPGGNKAIHEPWRMVLSALIQAIGPEEAVKAVTSALPEKTAEIELLARALQSAIPFPRTTSAGRLFDVMAFLLGAGSDVTFEAQHALWLESKALKAHTNPQMPAFEMTEEEEMLRIDPSAFWRAIVEFLEQNDVNSRTEELALGFHRAFIESAVQTAAVLREKTGINTAACSGGVFLNSIISTQIESRLRKLGFKTLFHHQTPPGDGCIALGQAAVAAAQIK